MTHDIQDERYSIVEDAIYGAFFELIKEKKLEKIKVSDITKRAGIVRSTFYNHYENIPMLVDAIEDKTILDIFTMMESFHPKNNTDICKSFFLCICEYTVRNPFLTELLRSTRGSFFFQKTLTMFHQYVKDVTKNTNPATHDTEQFSFVIAGSIGCTIGILHKWTRENCKAPAELVAEILTKTFLSGIFPFL